MCLKRLAVVKGSDLMESGWGSVQALPHTLLVPDAEPRRDARWETDLPCRPLGDDWPSLDDALASRRRRFSPGELVEMELLSAELYSEGLTGIGRV